MASLTEDARVGDLVKWMINESFCTEVRTIEAVGGGGTAFFIGDVFVLGTGVKLVNVGAANGAAAVAILLEDVLAADDIADLPNIRFLVRGPALIDPDELVWTTSATQKTAAIAALAVLKMLPYDPTATWSTQTT